MRAQKRYEDYFKVITAPKKEGGAMHDKQYDEEEELPTFVKLARPDLKSNSFL